MSTLTDTRPDTVADLIRALGDVPPHRILWTPIPGTATEADQLRLVDGEPKRLVEYIDGILVEKAMGQRESLLASLLLHLMMAYVRPRKLGIVGAPDAIMRMANGRNRLPDVYFMPWDRLPAVDAHLQPVAAYSGDLMVEVLSDGNTQAEIRQKRTEYFESGTRAVWIIDPVARTIAVYADPADPDAHTTLTAADTLTGEPVLPGFALPLAELFDDPQLNPRR